jgi:hypothetical protein
MGRRSAPGLGATSITEHSGIRKRQRAMRRGILRVREPEPKETARHIHPRHRRPRE